jgi:hypothetical protein
MLLAETKLGKTQHLGILGIKVQGTPGKLIFS